MSAKRRREPGGPLTVAALILSVIAVVLSAMTYVSSEQRVAQEVCGDELQAMLETVDQESDQRIDELRGETATALNRIRKEIRSERAASWEVGP